MGEYECWDCDEKFHLEEENKMGEYECWDCDEKFHLEEPPYDGRAICDECRKEEKQNEKTIYNINFNA
jgi:DNA-directed RNA polymerase subunit RPC12/RpoP